MPKLLRGASAVLCCRSGSDGVESAPALREVRSSKLTPGPADRTLIYLILFISDCIAKLAPSAGRPSPGYQEAGKKLATLAVDNFALPGEPGFPLNSMYHPPGNRGEAGECGSDREQVRGWCWAEGVLVEKGRSRRTNGERWTVS